MTRRQDYLGPVEVDRKAPDVMIVGVDVVRSIVHRHQPDDDEAPAESLEWRIQGTPNHTASLDGVAFRLFGDLTIAEDGVFIGVTSAVLLAFRRGADVADWTPDKVDEYTRRLGPWASHVLYDTAAACARRLAAQSFFGGPSVPVQTPVPTIISQVSAPQAP